MLWNREREAQSLSADSLQVKTYYFQYPSVEDLLDLLGGSLEAQLVGFEGGDQISNLLRRAGLERVDDFTLLSPRGLHIYEGIPVEAVRLLYSGADEMIRATHLGHEEDIKDVDKLTGL